MATSKKETPMKKVVAEKPVKTPVAKKTATNSSLSVDLFAADGKAKGTIALPESVFGQKVNKVLLKQAIYIYLTNQRQGTSSTKSRGEVDLTKAKWYRQKGTGRARHGAKSAPIFVKGGVAHGPKPRDFELSLSKVMKKKALQSALSSKLMEKTVMVVEGMETLPVKTKSFVTLLKAVAPKGTTVMVLADSSENMSRAIRNIENVTYKTASELTTYDVVVGQQLLIAKDALSSLEKRFGGDK